MGWEMGLPPQLLPERRPRIVRGQSSRGFLAGRWGGRIWSRRVKMAVFAPMPRARVRMATAVKPGVRARVRRAYFRSRKAVSIEAKIFISQAFAWYPSRQQI